MKKLLIGTAVFALLLSSCAKTDLLDSGYLHNDGKLRFAASAALNGKAATGHPLENTAALRALGSFNVKGYGTAAPIAGEEYVNATVSWQTSTQSWEYSNEPFWPDQALNFYAYAPTTALPGGTASIDNTDGVKVAGFVAGVNNTQVDLVIASALGKTKEERTPLIFKHALTQVVFKAMKITGSKLDVIIEDVEIVNIVNKGDFKSTTTPEVHYPQSYWTPSAVGTDMGGFNAKPTTPYTVTGQGLVGTVANAAPIMQNGDNNALLMIPQNFSPWDAQTAISANNAGAKQAYIKLTAKISTIVNAQTIYLHGSAGAFAPIYIPVGSLGSITSDKTNAPLGQWVPGRRINYIITFGDTGSGSGGAGYTDDPTDPTNPPVPVLVPIKFTTEMEDWVDNTVPLLTASFEGNSSSVNKTFIDGFTGQLLADIKSAIAPKKYNANVSISGTLLENAELGLAGYAEADNSGASFKFLPGTTITYKFNPLTFGSFTLSTPAAGVAGWTITGAPLTANGNIVLTRQNWLLADIKASVEKRAASAVYAARNNALLVDALQTWNPLYLSPGQTLEVQYPTTGTNVQPFPGTVSNWHWNATDGRAIYTQPFHATTVAGLATLLNGSAIKGYTYYINLNGGTIDLLTVTPNLAASGDKVFVVFNTALTSLTGTDWSVLATNNKIAVYIKP